MVNEKLHYQKKNELRFFEIIYSSFLFLKTILLKNLACFNFDLKKNLL